MSDWNGFAKIIFNVVYIFDKCYWNTQNKKNSNQIKNVQKTQETEIDKQKNGFSNWKAKIENQKGVCMLTGYALLIIYLYGINFCIIKILDKL